MNAAVTIFKAFLRLGLTSFGGPVAHIAYFREEFVVKRQWLSEEEFAQLLAICQSLPGPASSQLGFAIGLRRGHFSGALAAFAGFTLPSFILLLLFAHFLPLFSGATGQAAIYGLKVLALVVVAQGVWGMWQQLCPDRQRQSLAITAAAVSILQAGAGIQIALVLFGAVAGLLLCRDQTRLKATELSIPYSPRLGVFFLLLFLLLLFLLPVFSGYSDVIRQLISPFYQTGALVFGGGHVVLPLLEQFIVESGLVSASDFVAGYGAAQAIPGPMFAFAAYLGALQSALGGGVIGALLAGVSIFLPGFLLLLAFLPFWQRLSKNSFSAPVVAGINAVVVGLLLSALYDPVFTSVSGQAEMMVIAMLGFLLSSVWRLPILVLLAWCVAGSLLLNAI